MTDCQSARDYITNPVAAGSEDERLEWEYPDGRPKDAIAEEQTDKPRWIDTSAMICHLLTKVGNRCFADRLRSTISTGVLDLTATKESPSRKVQQQKARLNMIVGDDLEQS